jgi:hypothetical protein
LARKTLGGRQMCFSQYSYQVSPSGLQAILTKNIDKKNAFWLPSIFQPISLSNIVGGHLAIHLRNIGKKIY